CLPHRRLHARALLEDVEREILPKEGALIHVRLLHAELIDDVTGHLARGGRGQREHWNPSEAALQAAELAICGAKIVAPVADAMGFVDSDQLEVQILKHPAYRCLQTFGRGVEQLELAAP